ncbi:bifunctional DNA primase/polymerase [Streptomyces somaliensis]|uniref:bifunctional DNA primase/polymerase n=1 Tax=Streptomyces somaliensis TaxID=78355 RepID=UPI0020CBA1E6|nr:bifunctional DNA primase/polymerase [Streptomyces somaliensis]MCP9944448.1 bifunctional DNA primase/polymerase [Streptomyces somaliensis]MCP9962323.1 bifunctional DNA primase/polymerase [Streptomyces somaliensis]MCP9975146.1 bifunctional DNA primase/polymerase [Streptomyces somaliensis]
MGFTIGGTRIRETRSGRTGLTGLARLTFPGARRRATRATECTVVAEYTGLWGWDVVPGARTAPDGCSCGDASCAAPGAHPLPSAPEVPAGASLDEAAEAWSRFPGAPLLLPAGRSFDVLEVAEVVGRRALVRLERMGLPLGPVCVTPTERAQFFVAPGAARELPGLLYRLGWDDADLDLRCLGPGSWITAPPSDLGGLGPVRWLRPPCPDAGHTAPQARLLLGTLAYISHRSAMV